MTNPYHGHRFPVKIISYCVWLYYTFPLSLRDIEKMMLYRGITVTYEAIRGWCLKWDCSKRGDTLAQFDRLRAYRHPTAWFKTA